MGKRGKWVGAVALLSIILAACAAPATPEVQEVPVTVPVVQTQQVEVPVVVTQTPEPEGMYAGRSINFLTIQPHTVASKEVAQWFEDETGARVNVLVVPYANVTEKAVLDITSGAGEYDVVEYWYPMLGSLVENGVLTDVSAWWNDNADDFQASDFIPVFLEKFTLINGVRYGIPYDGDLHLLFYNTNIFDRNNLQPPMTWEDYLNDCKTITENESADGVYGCGIMGAKVPLILIGTYLNRLCGYGGSFFDSEGNPTINNEAAVAALEGLVAQAEYALPEPPAVAFDEMLGAWLTGRVGMAEFWTDLGQMTDNPEQSTIMGEWKAVPMPEGTGPNAGTCAPLNAGFGMGVSTLAQDPELALEFLRFNARPDINVRSNIIVGGLDPTRWSTLDNEQYREHVTPELADSIKAAHENAVAWPTDARWAELQEVLNENLSLALTGGKTPQEALDDTQNAWLDILE